MARVFVSYRRLDTKAVADCISDRLEAKYGRGVVFMQADNIPRGFDLHEYLCEQVAKVKVMLLLITSRWLTVCDERGRRRLDNPDDFIRIEVEAALSRKIPIMPVYVDGALPLRAEELPEALKPLSRRNGAVLQTGAGFHRHVERLLQDIEPHLDGRYDVRRESNGASVRAGAGFNDNAGQFVRDTEPHIPRAPDEEPSIAVARAQPAPRAAVEAEPFYEAGFEDASGGLIRTLAGHAGAVNSVALTLDGRIGLSGSSDKTLKLWDLRTGRELRSLAGHTSAVNLIALTPDGRYALSGSSDNTLKLWDLPAGREFCTLSGHASAVNSIALTPDGRYGLSGSSDNALKLWDLSAGQELFTSEGHMDLVTSAVRSPDGNYGFSGSSDATLKLRDLASSKEFCIETSHTGSITSAALTPDGRYAISGGDDRTLKLWDLRNGQELSTFAGHTGPVNSVAISPDGRFALSGSRDTTLKFWELSRWTQRR